MPFSKQITAHVSHPGTKTNSPIRFFRELLIWNNAWREYYRLQKLDAEALRDMGISQASRSSVTVSQIAARMRG